MKTTRCYGKGHELFFLIWRNNNSTIEFLLIPNTKRFRTKAQLESLGKEIDSECIHGKTRKSVYSMKYKKNGKLQEQKIKLFHIPKVSKTKRRIICWLTLKDLPHFFKDQSFPTLRAKNWIQIYTQAHEEILKG